MKLNSESCNRKHEQLTPHNFDQKALNCIHFASFCKRNSVRILLDCNNWSWINYNPKPSTIQLLKNRVSISPVWDMSNIISNFSIFFLLSNWIIIYLTLTLLTLTFLFIISLYKKLTPFIYSSVKRVSFLKSKTKGFLLSRDL